MTQNRTSDNRRHADAGRAQIDSPHSQVLPGGLRAALLAVAKGDEQRAMANALASGEPIMPTHFYDPGTRYDRARRSLESLRKRAEATGIVISRGPWGPRGGVRWQYNAVATGALLTTDPENLQELILVHYPERKTDRHRDTLRACLSNPNTPAASLMNLDLSDEADMDLRCALVRRLTVWPNQHQLPGLDKF